MRNLYFPPKLERNWQWFCAYTFSMTPRPPVSIPYPLPTVPSCPLPWTCGMSSTNSFFSIFQFFHFCLCNFLSFYCDESLLSPQVEAELAMVLCLHIPNDSQASHHHTIPPPYSPLLCLTLDLSYKFYK